MSTVIYPSPVFGPVRSRRLGVSLGINLLPSDGKWCSFDCAYCECGFNASHRPHLPLPTPRAVCEALVSKLCDMRREGVTPDVLTFAGNGEPTLHPQFPDIVPMVAKVRDEHCPAARLSILSNGTQLFRREVREALLLFDNNIQKLDTVSPAYIKLIDRPQAPYDVRKQIEYMAGFGGKVTVQTLFMCGEFEGASADNTGDEYVEPYLSALREIRPGAVMVYTIDRETPARLLRKAPAERLDGIARRVRQLGIPCTVSY